MTQPEKINFKNEVHKILKAPGNYKGGILEMTIVFDSDVTLEMRKKRANELVSILKSTSEIFRNVRLNAVFWIDDHHITSQVTSLAFVQIGKIFNSKEVKHNQTKSLDSLLRYLKLFHARSKLILVITNDNPIILDNGSVKESLSPFLKQKLLILSDTKVMNGSQLFFSCI